MRYINKKFDGFAKGYNLPYLESLEDVSFVNSSLNEETGIISTTILFQRTPKINDFLRFIHFFENMKIYKLSFETVNYYQEDPEFKKYIISFLSLFKKYAFLVDVIDLEKNLQYHNNKEKWIIHYYNKAHEQSLLDAVAFLNRNFEKFGFPKVKVDIFFDKVQETSMQENKQNINEIFAKLRKEESNFHFTETAKKINKGYFRNRKVQNYTKVEIEELDDYDGMNDIPVEFNCLIYKNELIDRNDIKIHKYWVTNKKDATLLTHITFSEDDEKLMPLNTWINVKGIFNPSSQSKYQSKRTVKVDSIIKIDNPESQKVDEAEIKRIEINAKSKMNAMDGLLDAEELVNIAKKLGHKALAILDSVSVQSFPKFASAAKKAGIKPIYGASFDVIDKSNKVFLSDFENKPINNTRYVVFDIETTNLSPRVGELIEFGASIVENNQIIDNIQFFVKSSKPLSKFTIELTKITDKMLQTEGLEIEQALEKIYEILNNQVVVAHNASFDINFIIQIFIDHKKEVPKMIVIDSLPISKLVSPESKKHRLGNFCNSMDIEYDSTIAHRANYDAEVLARALLRAFDHLINANVTDFEKLNRYIPNPNEFYKKVSTFNSQISIIALNQKGIKELFKLVSLALTERHYNGPKLFWEDIPKSENLLIGSGGIKGELIDRLLYSSNINLSEKLQKFDYIEVPHPEAFLHKISTGHFEQKDIENLLKELIYKAKELNKKVIAIGDVRFENEAEKIFYKSLVFAKGIGGAAHFIFDYDHPEIIKIPNLSYLTTDEMLNKFAFLNDEALVNEIVIENSNYIASKVSDDIQIIKDGLFTPKFDDSKIKLPELVYKNAKLKYGDDLPIIVKNRIEKELNPIIKYGFDVIYWISHILVKKSNDDGYIVGSRGSVGSSLVATLAGITEINPLEPHYICSECKYFEMVKNPPTSSGFDLDDKKCPNCDLWMQKDGHSIPFETFLGFNADKVPDIDLNFSGDYQPIIHAEVRRLFGEKNTFRAGTISTIKDKTAFGFVNTSNEKYHWNYSNTFADYISTKIVEVKRTTGQHPGGIIIIPKGMEVEDFTPINYPANDEGSDWKTTHFDYKAIHDNVLKLDLLGHVDPTAIKMLERLTGIDVKKDIPSKDPDVISLFSSTKALNIKPEDIGGEKTGAYGIPEFGTDFVRRMLVVANPKSFADLISISGLSHGTDVWTGNAETLISKKNMTLSEVISCRDDIMNFLISYNVDNLDSFNIMEKVRKGKGLTEEEEKLLKEHNVPEWSINSMKLIKYMFPRAHATAYVLMAWRIAWFKLYKPLEYYATFFTTRLNEFDIEVLADKKKMLNKIAEIESKTEKSTVDKNLYTTLEIARELYARGFGIKNIDIEKSLESEWIIDYETKSLIAPFSSIKGLGDAVAKKIIQSRNEFSFKTKEDFKRRSGVNNTLYNEIVRLGILDDLNDHDQMTLF